MTVIAYGYGHYWSAVLIQIEIISNPCYDDRVDGIGERGRIS